jgi:alpha-beta hydrolase superfamily lysophospholipase
MTSKQRMQFPSGWSFQEDYVEFEEGRPALFFNVWKNSNAKIERVLMVVHGQGEHGGRYAHFAHGFSDHYDAILALDLRGHGRSAGPRGHVNCFEEYVDDALEARLRVDELFLNPPVVDLLGHSMGGLIALQMLRHRDEARVRNCVLSSPALGLSVPIPGWKLGMGKVMRTLWPTLQMATGLNARDLTHDDALIRAHGEDQLNHKSVTPAAFFDFEETMLATSQDTAVVPVNIPLLVQVSGDDRIVSESATRTWFDALQHPDKTWIEYKEAFHEIYNETSREQVFRDANAWLKRVTSFSQR